VNIVVWLTLGLILARLAVELWLASLNRRHVLARAGEMPKASMDHDEPTYKKSVAYTLAKGRLGNIEGTCDTAVLLVVYSAVFCRGCFIFSPRVWLVGVGDGGVSVCGRVRGIAAGLAVRLVRAVPARTKNRVQHHDAENLVV